MDIFAKYATDPNAELNGVERKLDDTTMLLIARQANEKANEAWTSWTERNIEQLTSQDMKSRAAAELNRVLDVVSTCILLGWSGLQFKGTDLAYTPANARMLLEIKDFRNVVITLSAEVDAYRVKKAEAAEKN